MAITEKKIAQAALTTDLVTVYTVPVGIRLYVKTFDLGNTSLFDRTATVHFVVATDSPGTQNMIVPMVTIKSKRMMQWSGLQILNAGDTIQVVANGTGVTLNISGAESTV